MKSIGKHKRIFSEYFKIPESNYQSKIYYYERHRQEINQISQEEKIEIDVDYCKALFEKGKYNTCIIVTQNLLETVIRENIYTLNGDNIYNTLLFKKAACHFNCGDVNKSIDVLEQLIKISPESTTYTAFYKKCYRTIFMTNKRWISGLSIALFLGVAALLSIELLVIRPFYQNFVMEVEILRSTLFIVAICFLLLREKNYFQAINSKLSKLK